MALKKGLSGRWINLAGYSLLVLACVAGAVVPVEFMTSKEAFFARFVVVAPVSIFGLLLLGIGRMTCLLEQGISVRVDGFQPQAVAAPIVHAPAVVAPVAPVLAHGTPVVTAKSTTSVDPVKAPPSAFVSEPKPVQPPSTTPPVQNKNEKSKPQIAPEAAPKPVQEHEASATADVAEVNLEGPIDHNPVVEQKLADLLSFSLNLAAEEPNHTAHQNDRSPEHKQAQDQDQHKNTYASPVVKEGEISGRSYRLFADGSLEIDTNQSVIRFASMDEFRSFIQGNA